MDGLMIHFQLVCDVKCIRFKQLMGGEQKNYALLFMVITYDAVNHRNCFVVNSNQWLIKKYKTGLSGKSQQQRYFLQHTARIGTHRVANKGSC